MRLIALALAMFVAVGPAAAQSWREYSYPDYFSAVSFPADPKIENTTYQAADGRSVEARVYSVTQGNAVFKMTIVDLSETTIEESAVINHAIRTLSQEGEIKLDIPYRISRVFGRRLSIMGADGSHSSVGVFFYKRRLYQIEGKVLATGDDAGANAIRFEQSLVFTDDVNASWAQLVERFRGECLRQFRNLRGPGQAENVRERVRGCVLAKVQAEVGKAAAGQTPAQLLQRLRAECFSQFEAERKKGLDVAQLMRGCVAEKLGSAAPESPNLGDRRSPAAGN
jgi:hypothetical protein